MSKVKCYIFAMHERTLQCENTTRGEVIQSLPVGQVDAALQSVASRRSDERTRET